MAAKKHSKIGGTEHLLADDIIRSLRKILRKVNEHSRQLSRDGDVSISRLLCLRCVAAAPSDQPLTSVDIARSVNLTTPTVSRILDRLQKDGLIERIRSDEDRRKVMVTLTRTGRKRVENLPPPIQVDFLARLKKISRSEQQKIKEVLYQVVELMDASQLDAAPLLSAEIVEQKTQNDLRKSKTL